MEAGPSNARVVYLITYSQANLDAVPNRETFAALVREAFKQTNDKNEIKQWVCSQAKHADGNLHYHCAIKLQMQRRWLSARNYLENKYNVKVNFSDAHSTYYDAYKYCTKEDTQALLSENHPDLNNAPRTLNACNSKCQSQ